MRLAEREVSTVNSLAMFIIQVVSIMSGCFSLFKVKINPWTKHGRLTQVSSMLSSVVTTGKGGRGRQRVNGAHWGGSSFHRVKVKGCGKED